MHRGIHSFYKSHLNNASSVANDIWRNVCMLAFSQLNYTHFLYFCAGLNDKCCDVICQQSAPAPNDGCVLVTGDPFPSLFSQAPFMCRIVGHSALSTVSLNDDLMKQKIVKLKPMLCTQCSDYVLIFIFEMSHKHICVYGFVDIMHWHQMTSCQLPTGNLSEFPGRPLLALVCSQQLCDCYFC